MRRLFTLCFVAILLAHIVPLCIAQVNDPSPSTRKMAELLQKTYREHDWKGDPYKTAERIRFYQAQLAAHPPVQDEIKLRQAIAEEMLNAGDSQGAVDNLERARTLMQQSNLHLTGEAEHKL